MNGWHAPRELLGTYVQGGLDDARAASIEAHLLACDLCRTGLAGVTDRPALDRAWDRVVSALDAPRPGVVERGLLAVGFPDYIARLLAATPSLRLSWFAAVSIALAFAVASAYSGGGVLLFLAVAPLVPLAGVALAFGPGVDPTYEVALAAPMRSFRLLLIRALGVVVSSLALLGISALALPDLGWLAAAWLLPALGLSVAGLALSTYWLSLWAPASVALAWAAAVLLAENLSSVRLALFQAAGQAAFAMVLVASSLILTWRRRAFD